MSVNNILITGGLGYIGFHTAINFLEKGFNVYITTRHESQINTCDKLKTFKNCSIIKTSYEDDFTKLLIEKNIDTIIHCAGEKSLINSWSNESDFIERNIKITKKILHNLPNNVRNFIFLSSAMIYGKKEIGIFKENDIVGYENPYSQSKVLQEKLLENFKNPNLKISILRCFNPLGFSEKYYINPSIKNNTIIPTILNCINNNNPFTIYGNDLKTKDGTTIRDYIDIQDLTEYVYEALIFMDNFHTKKFNVWNIGSGQGTSVKELIKMFENFSKHLIKVNYLPQRKGEIPTLIANMEKTNNELGYKNIIPLELTIKKIITHNYT